MAQAHNPDTAYREFQATLRRYLGRRLDNPEDVDDVLQDVFLRVTRNAASLEAAKEPLAWLYSVAKSALIDHLRRQGKHAAVVPGGIPEDTPDVVPDKSSDEFSACLAPLIAGLPDTYRKALEFVDIEGGRQAELAVATGLNNSTIKSRVQRGRSKIKSAILACCQVERDVRENISGLTPGDCGQDCC